MAKSNSKANSSADIALPSLVKHMPCVFGRPPLVLGESREEYEELREHVAAAISPRNVLDLMTVGTVTDLTWEIRRYRRAIAGMIRAAEKEAIEELLSMVLDAETGDKDGNYSERYFNDLVARKAVHDILDKRGLDENAITAQAIQLNIGRIEKLEEIIADLEYRCHAALREHDRRTIVAVERLRSGELGMIEGVALPSPSSAKSTSVAESKR